MFILRRIFYKGLKKKNTKDKNENSEKINLTIYDNEFNDYIILETNKYDLNQEKFNNLSNINNMNDFKHNELYLKLQNGLSFLVLTPLNYSFN